MDTPDLVQSRQYLSRIGIWPRARQLNIEQWLENFDDGPDKDLASALLESYVHLNEEQILQAVASSIRSISALPRFGSGSQRRTEWERYLSQTLVSFPLGIDGDAAGSGYIFARLARDKLGFSEPQIFPPEQLIRKLATATEPIELLMLDDIAASGTQFVRAWNRKADTHQANLSFSDLYDFGKISSVYYVPVISTILAKEKIEADCPVEVVPTYLLTADYGVLDAATRLVPEALRPLIPNFLDKYGPRTGCNEDGNAGYKDLGLAISFHHGSPNNTIPIFRGAPKTNWTPLVS